MSKKLSLLNRSGMPCITALILFFFSGVSGEAQIFQYTFGGASTDAASGGVLALANNEYIAVGTSRSFTANDDIYVVKTNSCGALLWSSTYNISGHDVAHKIRQTSDGGFIIVGETQNLSPCCSRDDNDIFLLKISSTGAVVWGRIYGSNDVEMGHDVQIVPSDGGFLVAGRSLSFGQGAEDAFLMRTNSLGTVVWARVYGGTGTDYFLSCFVAANGDGIALGSSTSPSSGGPDLYLMRVSMATGINGPGFPLRYGGTGNEIGWSVIEDAATNIVMAGGTTSLGAGGSDGLLMKVNSTGAPVAGWAITYGGGGWDEFLEVKAASNGTYLVTGIVFNPTGGFGNYDAYVSNVGAGFALINHAIHGGPGDDRGYGIAEAAGAPAPESIIAGYTTSFGAGGQDLYLVRQRANGVSGCNDGTPTLTTATPNFAALPAANATSRVRAECAVQPVGTSRTAQNRLCSSCIPLLAPKQHLEISDAPVKYRETGRTLNNR